MKTIAIIAVSLIIARVLISCSAKSKPTDRYFPFNSEGAQKRFSVAYEKVWAFAGMTPEEMVVETSFGTARVNVLGPQDGKPLLLLPGANTASNIFTLNAAALSKEYRLYLPDTAGDIGFSSSRVKMTKKEEIAGWLNEVIDGLPINEPLILGGYSYGAWQAANYTLLYPGRVSKLVLIAPTGIFGDMSSEMMRKGVMLFMLKNEQSVRDMYEFTASPGMKTRRYREFEEVLIGQELAAQENMSFGLSVNPAVFTGDELASISVDRLLVIGDKEVLYKNLEATIERAGTYGFQTTVIKETNHDIISAQPDKVNRAILRFLQPQS